ncbi:YopX family protein [Staphylococcus haemolyticus]|uniref:YopX family protein n=1 Tax=Staphylococcus haemolyticus TaxID=1283 RepID=UPI0034D5034E
MESISFRAWDKEEKKMHKVKTIEFSRRGARIIHLAEVNSNGKGDHKRWHSSVELMQSTGLKDKNGIEIYEGDIVENSHKEIGFIKKCSDAFCFNRQERNFYLSGIGAGSPFEILGNVHQNPELLEGD